MATGCGRPTPEQSRQIGQETINMLNQCLAAAGGSVTRAGDIKVQVAFYCQQNGVPTPIPTKVRDITKGVIGEGDDSLVLETDPTTGRRRPKESLPTPENGGGGYGSIDPEDNPSDIPTTVSGSETVLSEIATRLEDQIGKQVDAINNSKKQLCPQGSNIAVQVQVQCKNKIGRPVVGPTTPVIWEPGVGG